MSLRPPKITKKIFLVQFEQFSRAFRLLKDFVIILISQDWNTLKEMDEVICTFKYDPKRVP